MEENFIQEKRRILVVRPDRIGDLVLSTPVFQAIKTNLSDVEVYALVSKYAAPVVEHNSYLHDVIAYDEKVTHKGISGFFRLVKNLKEKKIHTVVVLQAQFKICLALFVAGIPVRIGPFSKWFSYLLFNKGMVQRRSRVEMHETEYNLMLLRKLGIRVGARQYEPQIIVDADAKERMRQLLSTNGLTSADRFIIIHPGMGGSALNWPEGYYVDLTALLVLRGLNVVVTGSSTEKSLVTRVMDAVRDQIQKQSSAQTTKGKLVEYSGSDSHSGLSDLIALQSLSSLVVAPSTGPLHTAVAVGKPTVSIFPPIKVQSAMRWGPYAIQEERHEILVPDALCGQDFKCAGKRCFFYFCMERISVEDAIKKVFHLIKQENN